MECPGECFERGLALCAQNDFVGGVAAFSRAMALGGAHAETLVNRGAAHAGAQDHASALADYDAALQLDPSHALALFNRGNALSKLHQPARALADYTQALALLDSGRFRSANAHLRADVLVARGTVFTRIGDSASATRDLTLAVEQLPGDAVALSNLAVALHSLGRCDEAIERASQALALDGSDVPTLENRAQMLLERGLVARALADLDAAIALGRRNNTTSANTLNLRACCHLAAGSLDLALRDADEAVAAQPAYALVHHTRCEVLRASGRLADALAAIERSLQLDPASPAALAERDQLQALIQSQSRQ